MCRVTESIQKQHGKISKPTSHFTSPHHMVTIYHQDTITGQDNDHLDLTDSHFSQGDQRCDNSSSLSHDTGSFSLSNTISSVDLTTWGTDVRCHNQSGRSMGSTDTFAVVTTRRGLAQASQVWKDGRHDRTFNVFAHQPSATQGSESKSQMGKLHEMSAKTLDGEARLLEGGEGSTRESFGEGGNGHKDEGTVNTTPQMLREHDAKHVKKWLQVKYWVNCYSMTTKRIVYEVKPEKWNYLQVDNTARYGRQMTTSMLAVYSTTQTSMTT